VHCDKQIFNPQISKGMRRDPLHCTMQRYRMWRTWSK